VTTFIDTNVLIAVLRPSEANHRWSVDQLQKCKANGPAIISDIVYCELSIGMATKADLDSTVATLGLERLAESDDVLFRAGLAYKKYRQGGGTKLNVLSDFLIGALAEVTGAPLITANKKDFVGYFPNVKVICP
jgi:predicted nucleic acid-binding protein